MTRFGAVWVKRRNSVRAHYSIAQTFLLFPRANGNKFSALPLFHKHVICPTLQYPLPVRIFWNGSQDSSLVKESAIMPLLGSDELFDNMILYCMIFNIYIFSSVSAWVIPSHFCCPLIAKLYRDEWIILRTSYKARYPRMPKTFYRSSSQPMYSASAVEAVAMDCSLHFHNTAPHAARYKYMEIDFQ